MRERKVWLSFPHNNFNISIISTELLINTTLSLYIYFKMPKLESADVVFPKQIILDIL